MLALAQLCFVGAAALGQRVEVALEPGPVKASLEFTSFEREPKGENGRTILCGSLAKSVYFTLLAEPNFPFLGGAEVAKRRAKMPGFRSFDVGGVTCCSWEESGPVTQTTYHAYPPNADFLFDLHLSVTRLKGAKDAFARADFEALVRSFRVDGRCDVAQLPLPPELYAFRDEIAAQAGEQAAWVQKQCAARPNEWAPHYYLGALGYDRNDDALQLRGYERAAALLAAKNERAPKETTALVHALDALAAVHAAKQRFKDALTPLSQLVELVPADAPDELRVYRTQALYHLAACCAKLSKSADALANLRRAIEADPSLAKSAAKDELFTSLRTLPEFKKLVGS
ncbi:MAG: hypothetical protein K8S98_19150 [Planctomycetes bacterium]|nr:hypothetical protein [Planctomycetota bacterium]